MLHIPVVFFTFPSYAVRCVAGALVRRTHNSRSDSKVSAVVFAQCVALMEAFFRRSQYYNNVYVIVRTTDMLCVFVVWFNTLTLTFFCFGRRMRHAFVFLSLSLSLSAYFGRFGTNVRIECIPCLCPGHCLCLASQSAQSFELHYHRHAFLSLSRSRRICLQSPHRNKRVHETTIQFVEPKKQQLIHAALTRFHPYKQSK